MSINIIFGEENANVIGTNLIVLEVDSAKDSRDQAVKCFCVFDPEDMDETTMSNLNQHVNAHKLFVHAYNTGDLTFCENSVQYLKTLWCGQLNEFYDHALSVLNQSTSLSQ